MTETEYECPNCGFDPLERRKQVVNNEVKEKGWYCPDCENEWDEDTTFRWEDCDFPLWIEYEHYEDNYEMLRKVEYQTNLLQDRIPAGEMKYTVFTAWFKIDEDGSVEGPYDSRGGELV